MGGRSGRPEPLTTLEDRGIGVPQRVSAEDTLLGLREVACVPFASGSLVEIRSAGRPKAGVCSGPVRYRRALRSGLGP